MSRIDLQHVRRKAFGRWPDILMALGVPTASLTKKNKPCPCCGGTDRFSFLDKDQGRFVCRAHDKQGGDGFTLAMHWMRCDFPTTLRAIADVLGLAEGIGQPLPTPAPAAPPKATPARDNSAKLVTLWQAAKPIRHGDPVGLYLKGRGLMLDVYPTALRHHPALPYWCEVNGQPKLLSTTPAMLAAITSPAGDLVGMHRTYLTPDGHKADIRHPITVEGLNVKKLLTAFEGAIKGAAIRLHPPRDGKLAVCEGLETGLAVWLGSGLPVWPCVSAGGLERVLLPESISDVFIMADNDTSGTGQKAANALARRLKAETRRVRVVIPEQAGTDWLDVLNEQQEQEAA